jgi:RNA polymerase sigma factor (sigma-70 family)
MNYNVEFKSFDPRTDAALEAECRNLIEDRLAHLEQKAKSFPPDTLFLRIVVEKNAVRTLYRVSIAMEVPEKTLAAKEERHDWKAAIRDAFHEIEKQLAHHKASLRTERLWKRFSRRQEIRTRKIGPAGREELTPELVFRLLEPHLRTLQTYMHHLLDHARAMGDLVPDDPSDEDAVDTVLVRAYEEFLKQPAPGNLRGWLKRLATDYVRGEINRRRRGRMPSLEDDIPETPPQEEVTTLGEEILYFYQPDEDWKLEDIVPDESAPTPEQQAEVNELRECVRSAMAEMPREWRQALLMRHEDGLTRAEVAKATGKAEAEAGAILERAQQWLRTRLTELRCVGGSYGARVSTP